MIRPRLAYLPAAVLRWSAQRPDGLYYDFATTGPTPGVFTASPTTRFRSLTAEAAPNLGSFGDEFTPTPLAQWVDGMHRIRIHDEQAADAVVAELAIRMFSGDDAPIAPGTVTLTSADRDAIANATAAAINASGVALTAAERAAVAAAVGPALMAQVGALEPGETFARSLRLVRSFCAGKLNPTITPGAVVFYRLDGATVSHTIHGGPGIGRTAVTIGPGA